MENTKTVCLDVFVGRDEKYVNELIEFLKNTAASFAVTKAQRGRFNDLKSLRIWTSKAEELQQHITDGLRTGDDNDYEVHYSEVDAQRSINFMPDWNNPLGDAEFEIFTATDALS